MDCGFAFIAWQAIQIVWVWLRTMRQPHFERSDFRSRLFDLNQILGSPAYARVLLTAQMRQHPMATSVTMNTMNKGAFR